MKKILGILVQGLLWRNVGVAETKKPDWSKCDKTKLAGAADFIPLFCYCRGSWSATNTATIK